MTQSNHGQAMQHQLVLQLRRSSVEDPALVGVLETRIGEILGASAEMDGHDIGARDINLFILTPDPASAFRRSKPVLEELQLLDKVTAAHRVVGGAQFKVIWPLRVRSKFKIA